MASIIRASSSIVKAGKFIPQKKSAPNNKAKIESKSISLVPKKVQTNNVPPGKIVKSPSGGLVKYDDAIRINPTPISTKTKKDNPVLFLAKEIESKVIKIDKLLKSSFSSRKKESEKGRVQKEKKKFDKKENEIEKKGKFPGIPSIGGGVLGGFLDGLKRFFFFTLLGWLFFRLLPLLPKLASIANFIGKAMEFGFTLFSGIVSALTTFLAEGIKLTNTFTKGLGWLAGARTEDDFKKFESTFNRIVDLTLLAAMLTADAGLDFFKNKGRGGPRTPGARQPRGRVGGSRGVTTSGGRRAGRSGAVRERIRNANPFRERPSVTTSGGRNAGRFGRIGEGIRNLNPLRNRPRITGGLEKPNIFSRISKGGSKLLSPIRQSGVARFLGKNSRTLGRAGGAITTVLGAGFEYSDRRQSGQTQTQAIAGTTGSVAGGLAGAAAGAQAGAAAGAVIGAFFGGVGAAPGAVIGGLIGGIGGGIGGSMLGGKAVDTLTGAKGYSRGGIIRGYKSGGPVKKIKSQPINIELLTKKPEKLKSKKTTPGKDVGGEQQIKKIFVDTSPEEVSVVKTITSFFNPLASIFGFFGGGGQSTQTTEQVKTKNTTKNLPNPFQLLLKASKIFKEDPTGQGSSLDFIGKIRASAIDTVLGNKPDKGVYRSIASSILYLANNIANNRMYGIKSSIASIMGFQDGGTIPNQSLLSGNRIAADQENTLRSLTGSIEFEMEQSSNKVLDSVRGEIRKTNAAGRRGTGRDEMLEENRRRAGGGGGGAGGGGGGAGGAGGGVGASSGSANERAILDMIAQAEGTTKSYGVVSGGDVDKNLEQGKLTVKQVIDLANSYGTPGSKHKWSGATGRYQFMPSTLQDLIDKGVLKPNDKFTPEMQDKAALALIRRRGVDPSKPLTKDAVYKLGGEWASLEGGPEMRAGGSYSYNGRSQVKYNADQALRIYSDKLKAAEQSSQGSGVEALSKGFRTGLKTGPSERIGGSSEYHIDARFVTGLDLKDKIAMLDSMATAHASEGFVMEFSGSNVAGLRWNPNASQKEKEEFAKKVLVSHHSAREGYEPFDYYIVKSSAKNRFDKSAEGSNVMAPIIPGGTYQYQEGGGYGRFMILRDKNGREIMRIGHGDQGLPSPKEIGKIFKMDELPDATQRQPGSSKREYDVIIPLDHHSGNVPSKSLWPNASLGADGRERQAQTPTAELLKTMLEKKGLRVKIMRPEDYNTEDSYNKDLIRYSQAGSVVSSLHYDAPRSGEGIGFLARLGKSPDQNDRDYANKITPILQAMAREAGNSEQSYGGIDTAGNITMRLSGPATAALIELGALVEQEKKYGKQFWTNPEFIKHLNDIADATASSVQKEQPGQNRPIGQRATLNNKPVVWNGNRWVDSSSQEGTNISRNASRMEEDRYAQMTQEQAKIHAARPWWDKLGLFGGAAAEKKRKEEAARAAKAKPGAKPPAAKPTSGTKPSRWAIDPRGWFGKKEGGSIDAEIGKQTPNIPIPNSFAPYESPHGKSYVAIQPIIIEKKVKTNSVDRATPSPSSSSRLNSNRMDRMQSTSRK